MDRIIIEDLLLRCIVGINPDEREKEQDVNLRITLHIDLAKAGGSDAIEDTVDYKHLKVRLREMVEASRFFLIERLATEVAKICLEDRRVAQADIRIEKPGALRFARTVAVELSRRQGDLG